MTDFEKNAIFVTTLSKCFQNLFTVQCVCVYIDRQIDRYRYISITERECNELLFLSHPASTIVNSTPTIHLNPHPFLPIILKWIPAIIQFHLWLFQFHGIKIPCGSFASREPGPIWNTLNPWDLPITTHYNAGTWSQNCVQVRAQPLRGCETLLNLMSLHFLIWKQEKSASLWGCSGN